MINPRNPNTIAVWHIKRSDRARGTKTYHAGFDLPGAPKISRRPFRTATEALAYGHHVKARYVRLYNAAVMFTQV